MSGIISIIGALLVLSVIVFMHELGHFAVARMLGIKVEEFALGFGPKLFSKVRNGIRYSIRAFPLGGFCMFRGEDKDLPEDRESFNLQKPYKRFLTILAGPVMNILLALILAISTLLLYGDYAATVNSVQAGTPAEKAGVLPGDVLVEVNGKRLAFAFEGINEIVKSDPAVLHFVVVRGGQEVPLTAHDIYNAQSERNLLGIMLEYSTRRTFSFGEAISAAFGFMSYMVKETISFLINIFQVKNLGDQVMGPIGTIGLIGQAVRTSFESVMRIAMLISINLAIFNLFPFPGLDGARLVFIGYEKITGKPIPRDKEGMIHFAGFALLIGLILLVTFGDLRRIFGGP